MKHAHDYLMEHPMEPYRDIKDDSGIPCGMFMWSWEFHNAVNERLGKKVIDYNDAYELYLPKYNKDNVDGIVVSDDSVCLYRS